MPIDRRQLPLNALRAFEALGHTEQLVKAAKSLGVTHSAISHHIKGLEEQLNTPLFYREHKRLRLTPAGSRLLEAVHEGFDGISAGIHDLQNELLEGELVVACTPAVAANWMTRRLIDFHRQHPELHIRLLAIEAGTDTIPDDADLAICYGRPSNSKFEQTKLLRASFFPVCSPALLQGRIRRHRPEDVLRYTLLHDNENNWQQWLQQFGLSAQDILSQISFFSSNLAISAARAGTGLALADQLEVADDLRHGRLLRFCQDSISAPESYYLLNKAHPAAQQAAGWLKGEILAEG